MIFHDCGICPHPEACEQVMTCKLFDDRCPACKECREIEWDGMTIHPCYAIPCSLLVMVEGHQCPCGCDLSAETYVEPIDGR